MKIPEWKKKQRHLCSFCRETFPECKAKNIEFGNGIGNDNVIYCDCVDLDYDILKWVYINCIEPFRLDIDIVDFINKELKK